MFFVGYDKYEGTPPRLYRSPGEIRADINDIRQRISSAQAMLNIRSMLTDLLDEYEGGNPEGYVEELMRIADEANNSLDGLSKLRDMLSLLTEELNETVRMMKR